MWVGGVAGLRPPTYLVTSVHSVVFYGSSFFYD